MGDKKFTWLWGRTFPRRGPVLETGGEYSVADFGEAVVAHWVNQGAAKYVKTRKSEEVIQ